MTLLALSSLLIHTHYEMVEKAYHDGYRSGRIESLNQGGISSVIFEYCKFGVPIEVKEGKFHAFCMPTGGKQNEIQSDKAVFQ